MEIKDESGCTMLNVEPSGGRLFLGRAMLRRAQLAGADLRGAVLSCADLRDANLEGADLRDALLDDADLTGASLNGAQLAGANLIRAKLTGAKLAFVDLSSAVFSRDGVTDCPVLTEVDLQGANLTGQKLYSDFHSANFSRANLSRAWLVGPLNHARFDGANLEGTLLWGGLSRVDFRNADLSKINQIVFTGRRGGFDLVKWDPSTKWPAGFRGYRLAFHLLTWEELHAVWIVIGSLLVPLLLAAHGSLSSARGVAFWFSVMALVLVALRVGYLRHRKNHWW